MKNIADLLFEASSLKEIPRSGYPFLGSGRESVAEHVYCTAFLAFVMSQMVPETDGFRLMAMCLIHDLPEARTGDLNYVHRRYVAVDEAAAILDATRDVPFGGRIRDLLDEFNAGTSLEARLANDADQLAFILQLKALSDVGYDLPKRWLQSVRQRLKTEPAKALAETIMSTSWDEWWRKNYVDRPRR